VATVKRARQTIAVYIALFPNKTVTSTELEIEIPSSACISGFDNGKSLIIAYSGPRNTNPEMNDIYTIDSSDGGATWSKPLPVSRENMTDEKQRSRPNLLVTLAKRVFLFFECNKSICFSSRPWGSQLFGNEKVLSTKQLQSRIVSYEIDTRPSTVLVSWMSPKNGEATWEVVFSQDNGVNWGKDSWSTDFHFPANDDIDGIGFEQSGNFGFTSFITTSGSSIHFNVGTYFKHDFHLHEIEDSNIDPYEIALYRVASCAPAGTQLTFYYRAAGERSKLVPIKFYSFDAQYKLKKLDAPFAGISNTVYSPNLGCTADNEVFASSIAIINKISGGTIYSLMVGFMADAQSYDH